MSGPFDLGLRLQLLIGAELPVPAPAFVAQAFLEAEVTLHDGQRDGFQLTFALGRPERSADVDDALVRVFEPRTRVVVALAAGPFPDPLIDGMVTNLQVLTNDQPGAMRLVVTGEDISVKLDLEERQRTHPNQSDATIVSKILASYGFVPDVVATSSTPTQNDVVPVQRGTDLAYVTELARRNGYTFYVEPARLPGTVRAYFGPARPSPVPQPALTIGMGSAANCQPITFTFDGLAASDPKVTIVEPRTGIAVPVPVPDAGAPLSARPAAPLRTVVPDGTAKLTSVDAALKALTAARGGQAASSGRGQADGARYGHVLRPRRHVGVRGAGRDNDGLWYVKEVTHRLTRASYTQAFTIEREGRGAASPTVRP